MRLRLLLVAIHFSLAGNAQSNIDSSLKLELDSMLVQDQYYRGMLSTGTKVNFDSLSRVFHTSKEALPGLLWTKQLQVDAANIRRVEAIIAQYGYPGKKLVGEPTNEAGFYVLQHSNAIDTYLPVVQQAAEAKELPFHLYAMMLDRSLMYAGKEQIYGSQAKGLHVTNPATGKTEMQMFIWPIKDAATVNDRRKAAGFEQTVESNATRLGIEYSLITLEAALKMK